MPAALTAAMQKRVGSEPRVAAPNPIPNQQKRVRFLATSVSGYDSYWDHGQNPDPTLVRSLTTACELIRAYKPDPNETVTVTPEFAALIERLEGCDLDSDPVEWPWVAEVGSH